MLTEVMAACAVMGAAFVAGVGWSVYRAVGWVERIKAWAASVEVESVESGAQIVAREIDPLGVN